MTETDWQTHQAAIVAQRTEAADAAILATLMTCVPTEPLAYVELVRRTKQPKALVQHRLHVLERRGLVGSELRGGTLVFWRVDNADESEAGE